MNYAARVARWIKNSKNLRFLVIGCFLVLFLAQGIHYISRTSFVVSDQRVFSLWDDTMISMRYAKNFANGEGLVWNPDDDKVQGFTNLGLTVFMAALHFLPLSPEKMPLVVQLANLAFLVLILFYVFKLSEVLLGDRLVAYSSSCVVALYAPLSI